MATLLQNKTEGSIVYFNESGSPFAYYIVKHNYRADLNGAGRTLVAREDLYCKAPWKKSGTKCYDTSNVDDILSNEFKARLDPSIQTAMAETTFNTVVRVDKVYTGGATYGPQAVYGNISRAVFTAGYDEVMGSGNNLLPIASVLQTAMLDGVALNWWSNTIYPTISSKDGTGQITYTRAYTIGPDDEMMGLMADMSTELGVRPFFTVPDTLLVADNGLVVNNAAPVISGVDADLGTFGVSSYPSVSYAVTDADNDPVTVTVTLDGVIQKTHTPTLGATDSFTFTPADWMKVLNGAHALKITADDGYVTTERVYTFTKSVTSLSFALAEPLLTDEMVTKAIERISGIIPANAVLTVEVCNNGYDDVPTWEDVSEKVRSGEKFQLTNTVKTAENWGYNVRVSVSRGSATGECYVTSLGGFCE